jgi:hypothetical protein
VPMSSAPTPAAHISTCCTCKCVEALFGGMGRLDLAELGAIACNPGYSHFSGQLLAPHKVKPLKVLWFTSRALPSISGPSIHACSSLIEEGTNNSLNYGMSKRVWPFQMNDGNPMNCAWWAGCCFEEKMLSPCMPGYSSSLEGVVDAVVDAVLGDGYILLRCAFVPCCDFTRHCKHLCGTVARLLAVRLLPLLSTSRIPRPTGLRPSSPAPPLER